LATIHDLRMKFYAKTYYKNGEKRGETLQEHTENLLKGLDKLQSLYASDINKLSDSETFWEDLKIACLFHDLGKISTPFQNKIRRALKLPKLRENVKYNEIPHNYISPAFLIGYEGFAEVDEQRFFKLLFAIAFHHDRLLKFDKNTLEIALINDINHQTDKINDWLKTHFPSYAGNNLRAFYYSYIREYIDGNNDFINRLKSNKEYILFKGLLHRLDYAASAHLPVEMGRIGDTTPKIVNYLKKEYEADNLRPFQKQAEEYRNESVILTASTGMGKTEFAMNWQGDCKGFYTLPLKVSANAMFIRLNEIFPGKVGIIHSDSYSLAVENKLSSDGEELSIEESIQRINTSRQLSLPLIITTADQLFTSVFKWPGYERIYATLMYSKVILDEPQSYSPKTLAMIIRALEEITDLGGRFCYMSATNHPFIVERLEKIGTRLKPIYNREKKHKIEIFNKPLESLENKIVNCYNSKDKNKVLVITNTVKKSQDLFTDLKDENINVKLLHSGFIKKHRGKKEDKIQCDFKKNNPVVWISTQIVEASLDIDYDILFTEIATLDSLIQRMGRVYRKPGRIIGKDDFPNIMVASEAPSDQGYIYNKEIVQRTRNALKVYDGKILTEEIKQQLMNEVFDEDGIVQTKFYEDFKKAYKLLKLGFEADSRKEAQQLFRNIAQVSAIPINIYDKNHSSINNLIKYLKSKIKLVDRIKANNELNQFMLSIPAWRTKDFNCTKLFKNKFSPVFLIPAKYDKNLGLQYDKIDNLF